MDIQYTREFKRNLQQLSRRYPSLRKDIEPIVEQLKTGQTPGDQIAGTQYSVYKVRIKNSDNRKGKSGGYRMIYYIKTHQQIILITIYSKSEQSDIAAKTIRHIIERHE